MLMHSVSFELLRNGDNYYYGEGSKIFLQLQAAFNFMWPSVEKNTNMNTYKLRCIISVICLFSSCQKNLQGVVNKSNDNYLSAEDFFSKNEAALQTYTVDAGTGGTFTSVQGTKINIPASAFVSFTNGAAVAGIVNIEFKDLYKKSDMLLALMPTTTILGSPLKSGGEFFIKVTAGGLPVQIAPGKQIDFELPVALTGEKDLANPQRAFILADTAGIPNNNLNAGWVPTDFGRVENIANSYVFSLFQFSSSATAGTWCNSDNATYFSTYPQTTLTLNPKDDVGQYGTDAFLVFKNIASMVHVYKTADKFVYTYAPAGLQCTLVATGIKDGKLYSAFVPITITANQSIDFTLSLTNTDDFKSQLKSLD